MDVENHPLKTRLQMYYDLEDLHEMNPTKEAIYIKSNFNSINVVPFLKYI